MSLPKGWAHASFGELGDLVSGSTPSKARADFWNGSIPWISPKDMKVLALDDAEDHVTQAALEQTNVQLVPASSILVVVRSGILAHTLPVGVTRVPAAINQDLKALLPIDGVDPFYLAWFLRSANRNILNTCTKAGTTVASVRTASLEAYHVLLAPTAEQHRIVTKLDELFSELDAGVAAVERAQAKLERYRASVLKAAVEGRLTERWRQQNPPTETGAELLERILAERRRRWGEARLAAFAANGKNPPKNWTKKCKEPVAPDTDGLPELPEGWCWAGLAQLGELGRGKSKHRPRGDPVLYGGPYPFVQTGEVRASRGWIREFSSTYSEAGLRQSRLWPAGTLCITIAANIAETGILTFASCFPDSVVGLVCDDAVTTRFTEAFLRTARARLEQYAPATAQKNINLETLTALAVPLPPRVEQEEIVRVTEELLAAAASSSFTCDSSLARATHLRQSILAHAFEGRLVPQDPNDEPASVLLERIRAERGKKRSAPATGVGARRRSATRPKSKN